MNACRRYALLAATFVLLGASYGWLRGAYSGQPTRAAEQATAFPRQVMIIRHAEKPSDEANIHLTSRGAARAAALPSLFVIPPTFPSKPAPFAKPEFIFATKESKRSNRPVETVTPLARALDATIHQKQANEKYADLIDKIFRDDKHAGKTILICWHHGTIPDLARAVAARAKNTAKLKAQIPARWDGSVFDRVWLLTFDAKGTAAFSDQPQRLLFGDAKK